MAITNYSELQAAVANWLNRTDLTARIPEFISLAESRLNRELRTRMMESNETLTTAIGSRAVALPSGFLEPLELFIVRPSGREKITFVPNAMETSSADGEPRSWSIDNSNIVFEREADAVYTLTFKMLKAFALSDSSPTNSLMSNYPDLYLAASVTEGFAYLMDDMAAMWNARTERLIGECRAKENRSRAMAPLRSEIPMLRASNSFDIGTGD